MMTTARVPDGEPHVGGRQQRLIVGFVPNGHRRCVRRAPRLRMLEDGAHARALVGSTRYRDPRPGARGDEPVLAQRGEKALSVLTDPVPDADAVRALQGDGMIGDEVALPDDVHLGAIGAALHPGPDLLKRFPERQNLAAAAGATTPSRRERDNSAVLGDKGGNDPEPSLNISELDQCAAG